MSTAASAGSADPLDPAMDHVAISVPDIAAAEAFYVGALGLRRVWAKSWSQGDARMDGILGLNGTAGHQLLLSDGRFMLELWQFGVAQELPQDRHRPVSRYGITHFGLRVQDIVAVCTRLQAAGMTFHAPPSLGPTGTYAVCGRDPFGNVVELVQRAPPRSGTEAG